MFVVGSSIPGFDNLAQAVPGCDTTDAASNPSQACTASSVARSFLSSTQSSKNGSFSFPEKTFQTNLFNDSFSCPQSDGVPAFDGSVSVDLNSTISASLNYVVTYKSFLSVPNPSSITLAAGFDAALDGTLSLNANLMVSPHDRHCSSLSEANHMCAALIPGRPDHGRYHPVHGRPARPGLRQSL